MEQTNLNWRRRYKDSKAHEDIGTMLTATEKIEEKYINKAEKLWKN